MRIVVYAATAFLTASAPGWAQVAPPAAPAEALSLQDQTEALMKAALVLFQDGKFHDALTKIYQVKSNLNNKPFPQVLFVEGASYFNLGEYEKAITALEAYAEHFADGEYIHQVRLALGRSYLNKGEGGKGLELLQEVADQSPELKAEATFHIAEALRKQGKVDEALEALKLFFRDGIRGAESIQAAMLAADLYVAKGALEEASALMEKVRGFARGGDNIAQMNHIYLKLGDQMLERKNFREALTAYQMVRRKGEITNILKNLFAQIRQSIQSPGQGPIRGTPEELKEKWNQNQALYVEIEKRADYDALLYYRLGHCYFEMGRFWEALLAFEVILRDFESFEQRDRCLYGMITANAQLKRVRVARQLCERYMNEFPDGEEAGVVSEMFGMLAYENGQLQEAVDAFNKAESFPRADKERLRYLRANVLFEMQRFDDARTVFELLAREFPGSVYKDDALYRAALAYFYQNDSVNAGKVLRRYIQENPKGQYAVDARYRLAFIRFQGRDADGALQELESIVKDAPDDLNIGQVYALIGDIRSQRGEDEQALQSYVLAVNKAKSEDVLSYAMEQASMMYVGTSKWRELGDMWQTYLDAHKDNETQALKAVLWISRARVKEGKVEEAQQLLAQSIQPKIGNPANDQVEDLIQQWVQLMAPKRRRASSSGAGVAASPDYQALEKQLETALTPPDSSMNGTVQVRLLFARAWLAKVLREADRSERFFSILTEVASPNDLSPMLLATVGDRARQKGDFDKASQCYQRLSERFKNTEYADGAAVGLAEIAYEKGENENALELFNQAIEAYAASSRLLDATLGRAKTLFRLKRYEEAKKLYEQILNTKEWRGEAHAVSLFMQGEIEFAQKNWGTAIPFYQRVFIAYQRWKPIMAKAYLQCARAFVQLNRPAEPPERPRSDREAAKLLLLEMTRRTDLQDFSETRDAQQDLTRL